MSLFPSSRRRRLGGAAALALTLTASPSPAGTIGFSIDTTVTTGPGVRLEIRVTHTGDEAAREVRPTVLLGDRAVRGDKLEILRPGASHVWDVPVQRPNLPPGHYVIVTRLGYADANAYPFEVLAASPFDVGSRTAMQRRGTLAVPAIEGNGSAHVKLSLQTPKDTRDPVDVRIIAPTGLRIARDRFTLEPGANGRAEAEFGITNRNILPGNRVEMLALVTGPAGEVRRTDVVRGIVRVVDPPDPVTVDLFVKILLALVVYLIVLELVAGRRHED